MKYRVVLIACLSTLLLAFIGCDTDTGSNDPINGSWTINFHSISEDGSNPEYSRVGETLFFDYPLMEERMVDGTAQITGTMKELDSNSFLRTTDNGDSWTYSPYEIDNDFLVLRFYNEDQSTFYGYFNCTKIP